MPSMKYIITGTGRSGTRWCSETLKNLGEEIEWESVFFHDTTRLNLPERVKQMAEIGQVAESSWMAVPWLHYPLFQATVIYHVVRHPLKQMASALTLAGPNPERNSHNRPYHEFMFRHMPELRGMNQRESVMARYAVWNMWVEESSGLRFRLEDQMPEMFSRILGREMDPDDPLFQVEKHNRFQSGDPPILTWDDFPDGEWKDLCRQTARRYGYEV